MHLSPKESGENHSIANGKEHPTKERSEMALSRKFLSALGIEGDKVDEIIIAHSETVDGLKKERDAARKDAETYKADADKLPAVQKELEALKEAAEKEGGNAWKVKYDALKEENDKLKGEYDEFKKETAAKETKNAKEKAYRELLKEAGVSEKRIESVIKVTDLNRFELDNEGKIKDSDNATKQIKTEWADFITKEETHGADTATPPAQQSGGNPQTSRAAEIAKKYHENLYGSTPTKEG